MVSQGETPHPSDNFQGTDITRGKMCLGVHIPQGNTYHCNTGIIVSVSGVAKPGPTRAWALVSASGNSRTLYFHSIAICNDALFYALLTSLFARLAFNTGEDLYCVHV